MSKKIRRIFSIGLLFLGLFFTESVLATNGFVIQFQNSPLFDEANFLPGDTVSRWVRVSNLSGEAKSIASEAINWPGFPNSAGIPNDDLSRALNITILAGSDVLYGPASLFDFYSEGEVFLSTVLDGESVRYDFKIDFPEGKGDEWRGKTTSFDILIGSEGENGGGVETFTSGSAGGGGGGLPRGLTIYEPVSMTPEMTEATISWDTSYESTSRIIWSDRPGLFNLVAGEPGYGYDHWTEEDASKVIHHTVVLTGLVPGTTYYYRCVSHGSFALSTEYSFETLSENQGGDSEEVVNTPQNGIVAGNVLVNTKGGDSEGGQNRKNPDDEVLVSDEDNTSGSVSYVDKEDGSDNIFDSFLAAIGLGNYCLLLVLLICVLIILFFLCIKNGKIDRKKICWFLPLAAIALFALYCFYCPYCWYLGIAITAISLIVYIAMMLKA